MTKEEKTAIIEKYTQEAERIAADDTHGYSQKHRGGDPDFDCSSLILHCLKFAGIDTGGATYTGNMCVKLAAAGFKNIKYLKNINTRTPEQLQRGDILIKPYRHAVIYLGNGQIVAARHDEKGGVKGEQPGDQRGDEITTQKYYNLRWTQILRLY